MIKRWFFSGLLVWLPIVVTLFVISLLVGMFDNVVALLPMQYRPEAWLGMPLPGLGVLISVIIIFITGMIVTNFLGKRLVHLGEKIVERIPLVRSIYSATKQISETLLSSKSDAFRKVLLIEYPRKGLWSIAFQTGSEHSEIDAHLKQEMVTIFVPTTPNPTSGFLLMMPENEVEELNMKVEDALKLVVSLGTINGTSQLQEALKDKKLEKKDAK